MTGPEWDSSDEEPEGKVVAKAAATKKSLAGKKAVATKKSTKKATGSTLERSADESEQDATVLFIGHLPNEFEERDLKNFLQQFGKLVNIRISRSVSSGKSRGYAFVRWDDAETARIVAETLHGYLIGGRKLVCHTVPNPKKHMFYNTDKVIQRRKLKRKVEEKKRATALQDSGKIKEITARLIKREHKKRAKLEELGIEYEFPGYEASQMRFMDEDEEVHEAEGVPKSEKDQEEKAKKESLDSTGSTLSKKILKKRKKSVESQDSVGREANIAQSEMTSEVKIPQSEKKAAKPQKNKKRRKSAP